MNATKTYLTDTRGIEYSRIVTLDGGYHEAPTTESLDRPKRQHTAPSKSDLRSFGNQSPDKKRNRRPNETL